MASRIAKVLVVEDNPADLKLVEEMVGSFPDPCRLFVATDGEEAIQLLHRGDFAGSTHPDLIILDLNLPKKDGHEVLQEIKNYRLTRRTPVVVFSSSGSAQDVARAYQESCNCYVRKPFTLEEFERVVQSIQSFWLDLARLPN